MKWESNGYKIRRWIWVDNAPERDLVSPDTFKEKDVMRGNEL